MMEKEKTGPTQNHHNDGRATNVTSTTIKPKKRKNHKKIIKKKMGD